jgi:hypothetical protein
MPSTPPAEGRTLLRSWKAIAAHLQVDVRTVQRWHGRTDIPIYREGSGVRGHPTAYAEELDDWLTKRRPGERQRAPEHQVHRWPRAAIFAIVGGGLITLLAIVAGGLYLLRRDNPGPPFRAEIDHQVLRVFDAAGRSRWTLMMAGAGDVKQYDMSGYDHDAYLIDDVNGDGRREVLVNVPMPVEGEQAGRLVCFSENGQQLWEFTFGKPLQWGDRRFSGKYVGWLFRKVRGPDRDYILTVAPHALWLPTQVALLDPATGKLVEEYWHPGSLRLCRTTDVDGDGVAEVLLGGINNPGLGLGHGALVVLKVPFSRTPDHRVAGTPDFMGGHEAGYALLPRPDVCSAVGTIPFVTDLAVEADRIMARTSCGVAIVFHYLTFHLDPIETRYSDNFRVIHDRMQHDGLLDHAFNPAERACLNRVASFPTAVDGNSPALARFWKGCE